MAILYLTAFISGLLCLWVIVDMIDSGNMGAWWIIIYLISSALIWHFEVNKKD